METLFINIGLLRCRAYYSYVNLCLAVVSPLIIRMCSVMRMLESLRRFFVCNLFYKNCNYPRVLYLSNSLEIIVRLWLRNEKAV